MDGKMLRVNGQHSSIMLAELNGGFPEGLLVHIDEYVVDGQNGLALLFRQFDDRKSGRSTADISGAYQNLVTALQGVAKPVGKLGVEGIAWYSRNIETVTTPLGDEQYTLFHESLTQQYPPLVERHVQHQDAGVPAGAGGRGDVRDVPQKCRRDPDVLGRSRTRGARNTKTTPESTILDGWLKSIKEEKLEFKPGEYFRGCVYAWNASREDKKIKEIRYDLKRVTQTIAD